MRGGYGFCLHKAVWLAQGPGSFLGSLCHTPSLVHCWEKLSFQGSSLSSNFLLQVEQRVLSRNSQAKSMGKEAKSRSAEIWMKTEEVGVERRLSAQGMWGVRTRYDLGYVSWLQIIKDYLLINPVSWCLALVTFSKFLTHVLIIYLQLLIKRWINRNNLDILLSILSCS